MEIVLPHFNQKLNRLVRTLAGNFVMVEGWSKGQRKLCSLPGYMPIFVFCLNAIVNDYSFCQFKNKNKNLLGTHGSPSTSGITFIRFY